MSHVARRSSRPSRVIGQPFGGEDHADGLHPHRDATPDPGWPLLPSRERAYGGRARAFPSAEPRTFEDDYPWHDTLIDVGGVHFFVLPRLPGRSDRSAWP